MISMLSDPRKVSVSTEVEGRARDRLARMELMEEVLFFSCRCRCKLIGRGDSIAAGAAMQAAKFEARDNSNSEIRCIMMRVV